MSRDCSRRCTRPGWCFLNQWLAAGQYEWLHTHTHPQKPEYFLYNLIKSPWWHSLQPFCAIRLYENTVQGVLLTVTTVVVPVTPPSSFTLFFLCCISGHLRKILWAGIRSTTCNNYHSLFNFRPSPFFSCKINYWNKDGVIRSEWIPCVTHNGKCVLLDLREFFKFIMVEFLVE